MKCEPASLPKRKKDLSEENFGSLCKALGHPARVRILKILIKEGVCISGDLADEFDLAQSTVSEHLRILKKAGLIQGTIDGPRRCYCVDEVGLDELKQMAAEL